MIIKSIILKNMFSYKGENVFQLNDNLNVIIGENGFGKTSFINSLKICLHGITKDILKIGDINLTKNEYILGSNEKYYSGIFNRIAKDLGEKEASIELVCMDNEDFYKIKRTFNLTTNSYNENISILNLDNEVIHEDDLAQDFINTKFINQNLVNFFLFDGEKVQDISNFSDKEFSLMLESVFKELKVLDLTIYDMKNLKRKYQSESISDLDLRFNFEKLSNEKEMRLDDILLKESSNIKLKLELRDFKVRSTEINNKIKKINSDYKDELIDTQEKLNIIENAKLKKIELFKRDAMSSLPLLLNNSLKLSVEADILNNYFDPNYISKELIQKKKVEFITEINRRIRNNENIEDIMSVFDNVFLNEEKNQRVKFINNSTISSQFKVLSLKPFIFIALIDDIKNNNLDIDKIKKNISIIKNNIKENEIILSNLLLDKEVISNNIAVHSKEIIDNENIIIDSNIRIKEIVKEINTLTSKEFKEDSIKAKIAICEKLITISEQSKILIKEKRRESLEISLNIAFKKLIKNGYEAASLKVFNNFTINIFDKDEKPINILSSSSGQKQIIATALIWAITEYVKGNIPMVIDTPLGRLDDKNQKLLIDNFYKSNTNQLILLPTPSEIRAEGFNDLISQDNVCIYTLTNNGSQAIIRKGL